MLNELCRGLSVEEKLKTVPLGDNMQLIPPPLINVLHGNRIFQGSNGRLIILIDHKVIPPEATMLSPSRSVEIPGPQNLPSDTHLPDICVVSLKLAAPCLINPCPNVDPAVSVSWEPVKEL